MNRIFFYSINEKDNKKFLDSSILSLKEKKRAMSYRFEKDSSLYVAGKMLTRKIFFSLFGIRPEKIIFKIDDYGRPFLDFPKVKNFDFNLSHSGEYVVLAISDERVGIDIEKIKPIDLAISNECFHDKEIEYLYKNSKNVIDRFYTIWTLKEAFIKAVGQGLSYPLKNFYFNTLSSEEITINIIDDVSRWNFKMYDINKGYKMAVCIKSSNALGEVCQIRDLSSDIIL